MLSDITSKRMAAFFFVQLLPKKCVRSSSQSSPSVEGQIEKIPLVPGSGRAMLVGMMVVGL